MAASMTVPAVRAHKGGAPLVMVTAYDAPTARIADRGGVDLILVGDSVAMVVLGYEDTLQLTVDDMAHHVAAVARTRPNALVVGDLPWMSYHVSVADTVRNAATLVRAGAQAVKLEGGRKRVPTIEALLDAEIPVMGHIGLTPQSLHVMGGFKVQGRTAEAARALVDDAKALASAGCFAIVLEGVPDAVAHLVTESVPVPDDRHRCRWRVRRAGARAARLARPRGSRRAEVRATVCLSRSRRCRCGRSLRGRCARAKVPGRRRELSPRR